MRWLWTIWTAAAAISAVGCGPDPSTDPDFDAPLNRPQPRVDGAASPADGGVDADQGAPDADAGDGPDAGPVEGPCDFPADCPGGDCVDGTCTYDTPAECPGGDPAPCADGETCERYSTRYWCTTAGEKAGAERMRPHPCRTHVECGWGTVCHDGRCIEACTTDLDCATDGHCIDGQCVRFPNDLLNGDAPTPMGQPGQLYAGVGWVPLDYPVGVSLAGYGARPGPHTPYSSVLGGSDRFFEGQDVRAIALSSDEDTLIFIRLPLSWSTDYLLTLTAMRLQELTKSPEHPNGINYHSKLVTAATHSHSQPARYWYLLPNTGFAVAGYDNFSAEMAHRYADSFARAAYQALQNMQPARFGWKMVEAVDPEGRIHSDRRGANPDFKDDRMLVWRVDDLEGRPLAGMIRIAMHGTHMLHPWVTGDAPAGVETVVTEKLSQHANRPVPVMFVNGNAGDVSPRGDNAVAEDWAKMQAVGHRVWPKYRDAFDAIETTADWKVEVLTQRVAMDWDILGYDDSEFRSQRFARPHYWGGFQCNGAERHSSEPGYTNEEIDCRLNMETYLHHPVSQFGKTVLTAFRVGDLVVTTLPGEPVSRLGHDLANAIVEAAREAGETVTSVNFGYAQDHQLYLTPEEDWRHGGYEAQMSVWGWRNGDYLTEKSLELAEKLFTPEKEALSAQVKPTWFPQLEGLDDRVTPTQTPGGASRTFTVDPPAEARRGDMLEVEWTGGHPGVDLPIAHLERRDGDGWAPAKRPGGLAYDNWLFDTLTIYEGDYEGEHGWALKWELGFELAAGEYRVVVHGHEADAQGDPMAYEAVSAPFTVRPATLRVRDAAVVDGKVRLKVNYPNGPSTDDGRSAFAELKTRGHWLRYDADRELGGDTRRFALMLGGPVEGDLTVTIGGAPAEATLAADTVEFPLVTSRDAEGAETTTTIAGWPTVRLEAPAPAPGEHEIVVTDAHGNTGAVRVTVQP